jgi:hypothetical protein
MRALVATICLLSPAAAWAQAALPVIRAQSRLVTITDGLHVKKDAWFVMPERNPDVYYVEIPLEPHDVTFTTDVESITLPVTYGAQLAFVIRLAHGREARTEVRAAFRNLLTPRRTGPAGPDGAAHIPFTLGDNDKIYLKGRINGGPVLDVQFDLGAGGSLVKTASVPKANLQFDGTIRLRNSDGEHDVPSSSANRLEIAGLTWDGVGIAVADNMTHREDALVGNSLFQDKVLVIDYGRMALAVHDALPALGPEWIRQDVILDGVVPFARGTLAAAGVTRDGWFMLDTGAYTSILNAGGLSPSSKMVGELRRLLRLERQPVALSIAGRRFVDPNFSVRRYDGTPTSLGLLGNDVLKRFDLVLDNRRGAIYFRPNAHIGAAFRNPEFLAVRVAGTALVAAGVLGVWLVRRLRRRRRRTGRPA